MDRTRAVDHVETILETVRSGQVPVPISEVWVLGDLALGLDPIDRFELYVTKELYIDQSDEDTQALEHELGVEGIGTAIDADWARSFPELVRTNGTGYVAPEKCLAAQFLPEEIPAHLEVCNTGFEQNVTRRCQLAAEHGDWAGLLDPRAVCVWQDGHSSEEAIAKLDAGEYAFPPLEQALEMLGLEPDDAATASAEMGAWRNDPEKQSIRSDVM